MFTAPAAAAAVARLVHQQPGVARQRGRVAADVDDALRRRASRRAARICMQVGQRLGQRERAFARRVDQPLVGARRTPPARAASARTGCARRSASCAPGRCAAAFSRERCHQRLAAFDAQHLARARGQRQREVAEAAEPVDHALVAAARRAGAARAPTSTRLMCVVDLREVGRLERHRDAELGQRVGQLGAAVVEQVHACPGPWAAATTARRAARAKARSRVAGRPRSAARDGAAPARSRSSPTASSICGRRSRWSIAADQRAQRQQQRAHVRRQHLAARACRPRSATCARGSRPAPCPSSPRGAPTGARGSGSPRPALRSAAARARACTLPRCHRLSSSARCLIATCAPACRCCILQPPQAPACRPKCGQRGRTRCALSRAQRRQRAPAPSCSCARCTCTCTCSPGSAPSMNTTLPSALCATPCASRSSDSTFSHSLLIASSGVIHAAPGHAAGTRPSAARRCRPAYSLARARSRARIRPR